MKKIAIFGAGGFGLEVAMLVEQINMVSEKWDLIGFFDDNVPPGKIINGYPVLGGIDALNNWESDLFLSIALGNPKIKITVIKSIENKKISFPILIHPSVIMGDIKHIDIGAGSIICAGTIITTNIVIGEHVILNLSCTVGHQAKIGSFSSFMPTCNISGEVEIAESSFWGTGAKVINQKKIGKNTVIGAGAVVVTDLPENVTAVGVPAKIFKKNR